MDTKNVFRHQKANYSLVSKFKKYLKQQNKTRLLLRHDHEAKLPHMGADVQLEEIIIDL